MLIRVEQLAPRAPACSKNGFKWYLFAFYDLKAILSIAVSPSLFAVSASLKSAEVLQVLKGQADDGCIRISEGQGDFLFYPGGSEYVKMGLPGPFLVFSASTIIHWRFNLAMCRRKVLCENPTS